MIRLADDLDLPLEAVTDSFAIYGKKRTGKSNTGVVFCEGLWANELPFVVIDPKGDWYGMRAGPDGTPDGGLLIPIFGGEHGDWPLFPDSGEWMARLIVDRNVTAILDVSEFAPKELRQFVSDFLSWLYKLNPKTPRMVVLEEAQEIAPQITARGRGHEGDADMVATVKRLVKLGGFKGLGTCLLSQRPAEVNKGVTTQVETLIVHRITGPQDKRAVSDWVSASAEGAELVDTLAELGQGEAWVWSPHFLGSTRRVQMRRRQTFDSGATPEIGEARPVATLASLRDDELIAEAMTEAVDRAAATDDGWATKRIADLEAQLALANDEAAHARSVPTLSPDEWADIRAFNASTIALTAHLSELIGRFAPIDPFDGIPEDHPTRVPPATLALMRSSTTTTTNEDAGTFEGTEQAAESGSASSAAMAGGTKKRTRPTHLRAVTDPPEPPPAPARTNAKRVLADDIRAALAMHGPLSKIALAIHVGKSHSGGYFNRTLTALRNEGHVEQMGGSVGLTGAGLLALGPYTPLPSGPALIDWWCDQLPGVCSDIIRVTIAHWPNVFDKDGLAKAIGKEPTGGYFNRQVTKLRNLGLLDGFEPAPTLREALR